MKALERRLNKLEYREREPAALEIMLFWDEELVPCRTHADCGIEHVSGAHHSPLIRLSFGDGEHA